MASVRLTRLEIWSDFECAGGSRIGFYQPLPASALRTREINGEDTLRVSLYRDADAWEHVARDRVLRAHLAEGSYYEYRIADIGEQHRKDGALVSEVLGEGPIYDLGHDVVAHVLGNGDVLHDFPITLTPTEHINLALDKTTGFTSGAAGWWSVGTVSYSDRVAVNLKGHSALAYLRELQKQLSADGIPSEVQVVRVGVSGYRLDLLAKIGTTAEVARLRWNRNLHDLVRADAAKDAPTRVYPFGQDADGVRFTIGDAQWQVDSVASNDVTLLGSPIAFDDQFNGLYLERPNGTLVQISDTVKATQTLTLASTPGFSAGLVRIRKNSSGHQLTYLERPSSGEVRFEPLERQDIPPVDNLVTNPFLDEWSGGLPVSFAAIGSPTISQQSGGGKVLYGGKSALVTAVEEEGITTDWINVSPTERRPFFLGQVALYPIEGVWRLELLLNTAGGTITIPYDEGDGSQAFTSVTDAWVERLSIQDQAVNFYDLGVTQVKIRMIATLVAGGSGTASCYFDAAQLVQTHLPDLPFFDGRASRTLWRAANERLAAVDSGSFQLQVGITDLYRLDSTAFPYDQLVLGGTVQVQDPKLGLVADVRIRKIREELMQEGATEIEISNAAEEVTDVVATPPETGRGGKAPQRAVPTFLAARAYINGDGDLIFSYRLNAPYGVSIAYGYSTTGEITRGEVIDGSAENYGTNDSSAGDELTIAAAIAPDAYDDVWFTVVPFSGAAVAGIPGEMFTIHLKSTVLSPSQIPDASIIASKLTDQAKRFFIDFTVDGAAGYTDRAEWDGGTLTLADGTEYTISSGFTTVGTISAPTFIYFDAGVSTGSLLTTSDWGAVLSDDAILVAVGWAGDVRATLVPGVGSFRLDASSAIYSSSVTTDRLAANSVTAAKIASIYVSTMQAVVGTLSALRSDLGTVTAGTIGASILIATGKFTASSIDVGYLATPPPGTDPEHCTIGRTYLHFDYQDLSVGPFQAGLSFNKTTGQMTVFSDAALRFSMATADKPVIDSSGTDSEQIADMRSALATLGLTRTI